MANNYEDVKQQLSSVNRNSSRDDIKAAHDLEYKITDHRIAELNKEPIKGNYDFEHLRQIHHKIFERLYEHAGKLRDYDFRKVAPDRRTETAFSPFNDAKKIVDDISQQLASKNYLKGLDAKQFIEELLPVYSQLNYAHPFEEGNGRTLQAMMKQLANDAGYQLNFDKLDKTQWAIACAKASPHNLIHESIVRIPANPNSRLLQQQLEKALAPLDQYKTNSLKQLKVTLDSYKDKLEQKDLIGIEVYQNAIKEKFKDHPELRDQKLDALAADTVVFKKLCHFPTLLKTGMTHYGKSL